MKLAKKMLATAAAAAVTLAIGGDLQAVPFTEGNLVVSRFGTGSAALTSAGTEIFLDEYTPAGALVQSVAMPTAASGSNKPFVNSGTATSNGALTLSSNGEFLTIAGYAAAPGTAGVTGATSATVNRVIGLIDSDANVDTSTGLSDAYNTDNFRAVVTDNGTRFWTGGNGSGSSAGVRLVASVGATTSTQLSSTPANTRFVNIAGGQLYVSSATGTFQGVSAVGTGLPTTTGQTTTALPGFPTSSGPSNYDFVFADANTLYVADDRSIATGGGLQKWTFDGSTWTFRYTLNAGLSSTGLRGLAGSTTGGVATLIAVAGDQDGTTTGEQTRLVQITDTLATTTLPASTFSIIASSGTNTVFRGVDFAPVPEPTTLGLLGVAGLLAMRRRQ